MTIRQKILKAIYPYYTRLNRALGINSRVYSNETLMKPGASLYDLGISLNNGENISLSAFKGKKLLLVNTASDCGFTDQFDELQELYEKNKEKLIVIGFPANDFKEQEKKSDEEIAAYCRLHYGVTFPLSQKTSVIPGPGQHPVFQWLTDKNKNGWTNKKPVWNFSKYLVDENGTLINYFDPSISPTGKAVLKAINK